LYIINIFATKLSIEMTFSREYNPNCSTISHILLFTYYI